MEIFLIIGLAVIVVIFLFQKKLKEGFNLISKQEKRLKKGIDCLEKNKEITNEQYRELTGVTRRQAVRDLDVLEKKGIVKQVRKTGRNTKYRQK